MLNLSNLESSLIERLDLIIYASFRKANCRFRVESVYGNHTLTTSEYVIQYNDEYYKLTYDYNDSDNYLTLKCIQKVKPVTVTKIEWR